ncbi:hypothetical protein HD554DRAFT_1469827 [Boletus coccyginus]|nr:hypothetical protein HD554DRAFT_1469827 [Boletus coccyginus]
MSDFSGRKIVFPIALNDQWTHEALERYTSSTRSKTVYLPCNIGYLATNNEQRPRRRRHGVIGETYGIQLARVWRWILPGLPFRGTDRSPMSSSRAKDESVTDLHTQREFLVAKGMSIRLRRWTREPSKLLDRWLHYTLSSPEQGTSSLEGRWQPGKLGWYHPRAPMVTQAVRSGVMHDSPFDQLKHPHRRSGGIHPRQRGQLLGGQARRRHPRHVLVDDTTFQIKAEFNAVRDRTNGVLDAHLYGLRQGHCQRRHRVREKQAQAAARAWEHGNTCSYASG